MLILMKAQASDLEVRAVCERVESLGFHAHAVHGTERVAIGVSEKDVAQSSAVFEAMEGVAEVVRVSKPYKLVSRECKANNTIIRFAGSDATIGGRELAIIAGPCVLESREQMFAIAGELAKRGVRFLRAGGCRPRTSPYSFQGLGVDALKMLAEVRKRYGLLIVTEAVDEPSLQVVEQYADVIQIGSRNMQNFPLLKAAGRSRRPVLLRRGMSATVEEYLLAAEYVMSEGNSQVILCERGVRTFSDSAGSTLDLSVVPVIQQLSHLPIVVDPSHGTGRRDKVTPLARAAVAVGADGLMIDVHSSVERALSDEQQSLTPAEFDEALQQISGIAALLGRTVAQHPVAKTAAAR